MDDRHAEFLDRNYRYQRHIYDLTREYYLLGRQTLIAGLVPPVDGTVLEIGCGTARNLVRAAQRYPKCSLYGLDLSNFMLETAGRALDRAGLTGRAKLALGDATEFDAESLFGRNQFDRVFFSYSLSMIPAWEQALTHAAGHLTATGSLHVVDFGPREGWPGMLSKSLDAWLAHFSVTPRVELATVLRHLASAHKLNLFISMPYRGYATYGVLTAQ